MREVLLSGRSSVVLLSLAVGAFAFNTVEMMPLGMLPQITAGLNLTAQQGGALVSGYASVIALATVPLVRMTRHLPLRRLTICLMGVLTVCTCTFAASDSLPISYGSRYVTAAAHGLLWSLMAPAAVTHFATRLRGRVLSVLSVGASLAAIVGVPGSTFLGGRVDWRAPFLLAALLGALVAGALWLSMSKVVESSAPRAAACGTQPRTSAFVATLFTVTMSVCAVFLTMTYLSLMPNGSITGTNDLTVVLSVFGLAGTLGAFLAGRWLDRRRDASLAVGLLLLLSGLGTWTAMAQGMGPLYLGAALVGASALVVPLTCQHMLFDNSPLSLTMALALHSLAFNVGVAAGGFVGGLTLRLSDPSMLAPASLALAMAACVAAVVAVRATRRDAGLAALHGIDPRSPTPEVST